MIRRQVDRILRGGSWDDYESDLVGREAVIGNPSKRRNVCFGFRIARIEAGP